MQLNITQEITNIRYNKAIHSTKDKRMNKDKIQQELQNSKIRQGMLLKRSKFLKQWRQRWVILTLNYMITFTNKSCKEITDVMDIRAVKSYKSYVSKSQEMIPASFKLRSGDTAFYFCAKNVQEKWSWLVSIQRLIDYKESGPTNYNNLADIKKKGFPSQEQYNHTNSENPVNANIALQKAELINAKKQKQEIQRQSVQMAKKIFNEQQQLEKQKQRLRRQFEQLNQYRQTVQQGSNQQTLAALQSRPLSQMQDVTMTKKSSIPQTPPTKKGIVQGIFQQFRPQSDQFFGFKYYIDFLINVCSDSRLSFKQSLMDNCKNHKNNRNFAKIFVQFLSQYQPVTFAQAQDGRSSAQIFSIALLSRQMQYFENWMKFINLLLMNQIMIIFTKDDLGKMSRRLKFFLLSDQADSSQQLKMILLALKKLSKVAKIDKEEVRNRLQKIQKYSKKQQIAELAKTLLAQL